MISKKVHRKPENDNYRALAIYIDGGHTEDNEKVLDKWYAGGLTDEYDLGMIEVEATQALNKLSTKEKTYHLVLSFYPQDEAKLTPAIFKEMETEFAKALGFENHQRHCGVHQNTNNMHMHIAYNMINPDTFNRYEMKGDFYALSKTCRELEQRYELVIDNGIEKGQAPQQTNAKAKSIEVATGQQSFYSYAIEKKTSLIPKLDAADSWDKMHQVFAEVGIEIKQYGNGLILKDIHNKKSAHIKASDFDRGLSKGKLEKRLGQYEPSKNKHLVAEDNYTAKPLQKGMEREGRAALFNEFQAAIQKRKNVLETIKQAETLAKASELKQWADKRLQVEQDIKLSFFDKNKLKAIIKLNELKDSKAITARFDKERSELRKEVPFINWTEFLQNKARAGDETALAILRSKNMEVEAEKPLEKSKWEKQRLIKERWQMTQADLRQNQGLAYKDKKSLVSVAKMRQLEELAGLEDSKENIFKDFKYEVDAQGNVLFQLAGGGFVRDTGKEVFFNVNNEKARQAAELFAKAKWGKNVEIDGNKLVANFEVKLEKGKGLGR